MTESKKPTFTLVRAKGKICSAFGCTNYERLTLGVPFYRFPRDESVHSGLNWNAVPTVFRSHGKAVSLMPVKKRKAPTARNSHPNRSPKRKKTDKEMATQRLWLSTGQFCAAPNCSNNRKKTPDKSLHRFPPNDPTRCKQWVINCRRADLMDKPPEYLSKNCVLCQDHFEKNQYLNPTSKRLTLVHDAVPTLFNIPDSPPVVTVSRRKVTAPLTAGERKDCEHQSAPETSGGQRCTVQGCSSSQERNKGITFFALPCGTQRWGSDLLKIIRRDNMGPLPKSPSICSRHFENTCFKKHGNMMGLIRGSLPTKCMPGQFDESMSESGTSSTVEDTANTELLVSTDHGYAVTEKNDLPKPNVRRSNRRCCAIGCKNNKNNQPHYSFFGFPTDAKRCKKWVWNCRRADFDKLTAKQLSKSNYSFCEEHFEDIMFINANLKTSLTKLAVPTLFTGIPNPPPRAVPKRRLVQRSPLPPKRKKTSKTINVKKEPNVTEELELSTGEKSFQIEAPAALQSEPIVWRSIVKPAIPESDDETDLSRLTPPGTNPESDDQPESESENQAEETTGPHLQNTCVTWCDLIPLGKDAYVPTLPSLSPPVTTWTMDDQLAGIEVSAKQLLERAVKMDKARRFTEALICYQEGIQLLLNVCKATTAGSKKQHFQQRISGYMDRAEKLKSYVEDEKKTGNYHEQTHIEVGSTGHSYERVMGRFMDGAVTRVDVEDPYIRSTHQVFNFLRLCELIVKRCDNVKTIHLTTGSDEGGSGPHNQQQAAQLHEVSTSLQGHGVTLHVQYSQTLHDREIRLDNGWIIKIGRGLDYFKPAPSKFGLGYCDYDFRACHATTVDIFHRSP